MLQFIVRLHNARFDSEGEMLQVTIKLCNARLY